MRFNRIFWKIFATIWLVNVLVVACVVWVVNSGHLRERMQHNHTQQIERLAERLIAYYEQGNGNDEQKNDQAGEQAQPPNTVRVLNPKSIVQLKNVYKRMQGSPKLHFMIENAYGEVIFTRHKRFYARHRHDARTRMLNIDGASGNSYAVYYLPVRPPRFIGLTVRDVLSAQLLLMLLGAALLSALISWRITQPLKRLQSFSRAYKPASNMSTLDSALLKRGDELGDLARDIARMTQQVDAAFCAQEDLLHDVSHELRAPLARLQVGVALLEDAAPNHSAITKMHAECERMNALISRVLEYSRLQSTAISGVNAVHNTKAMGAINLQPLLKQIADDIKFEFNNRPINFYCNVANAYILGDEFLVQSALENLMRNACKYTPEGTAVALGLVSLRDMWQITVRDYGQGVDEDPAKLLKPFYRAGGQMHTAGFGLGLSIATRALEVLGGTLKLANHKEGGLIATIHLPKA